MREWIKIIETTLSETSWDDDDFNDDDFNDDDDFDYDEEDDGPEIETTGYNFGTIKDFYSQVVSAADNHMGMGDEIELADVAEWVEHHQALFQPGRISVYRTMFLNPSFVKRLETNTRLGHHWTYEFDADVLDGFDINGSHYEHADKGEAKLFVFEGEIETRDAHIPLTVAYNCLFPHEKEIFLTGGVTLKSITEFDFLEGHREKVRLDLIGNRFGA